MVQADYGTTTHGATLGIDVDSTTVKAVLRRDGETLFADYRRHHADARSELARLLDDIAERFPTLRVKAAITGSGGLAVSQILEVPFVQEVIAGTQATRTFYPQADVVIEVGGVFAKSDLQPLINQGAAHEDLAASIFQSVATQTVAGLANGRPIRGTALFLGGPLHFLPELRPAYERILSGADDSRNCPIVATYPEALRNNMGRIVQEKAEFISPFPSLADRQLLPKRLAEVFAADGVSEAEARAACEEGWKEMEAFHEDVGAKGEETLDALALGNLERPLRVRDQWAFHSRLYEAAETTAEDPAISLVQLVSFGCGLDAITADQVQEILEAKDDIYTSLKIDEVSNLGAA